MKRIVIFTLIFLNLIPFSNAQEKKVISMTIDEAIQIALRDNRDILLKKEDINKAKEKIKEAKSGLFPSFTISAGVTDTRGYYADDLTQSSAQATLKQYLYKGGSTVNTIEQNKYRQEASQALADKAIADVILNVKKSFYLLAIAQEFEKLNKEILQNTKEHLVAIQERYKNGLSSQSDKLKISESMSSVEEAYQASLNQVSASQNLLKNLLFLEDSLEIDPKFDFVYTPKTIVYDEAILKAIETRPEIKQLKSQVEVDKKSIEIAKSGSRPSVYASWDYYSRSHIPATTQRGWNDYNVLGITFTWPIFDGWLTKSKVDEAIIDLKETQILKEKTLKDVTTELKNAYIDLNNAINKIKSTQAQVDLYKDTLSTMQDKYKSGIVSELDLHNAILGYNVSLFNQKETIYEYLLAQDKFYKAMGGI